jgi:catechol 2,3-dioxygenase-like lactoylglutathione lyase family enzyme
MPLDHLEHFLIQTADIEATRDWYVKVLGLREGYRPDFKFPVFLIDPNGVKIEFNFSNSEAQGIQPELMASELQS